MFFQLIQVWIKNGKRFDLEFTRNTIKQAILTEYPLEDDSEKVLKKLENLIEQKQRFLL